MHLLYKTKLFAAGALVLFLAGCAAQTPYLKLDPSLRQDIRNFSGAQYLPLARLCDVYGLGYKLDSFTNTATVEKASGRIILRSGSDMILSNGVEKRLDRPAILAGGAIFVPVSFARKDLGMIVGVGAKTAAAEMPAVPEGPKRFTIKTIVIDPGHGGRDVGATGRRLRVREKDMALILARKIRDILERAGIKVIMTRNSDIFIPLSKRADMANRNSADLFVSIHLNASRSRFMRGFECYYLSNATDDNARALEAFEDSTLKLDKEADAEHSRGLDKTLWDMTLTENRLESAELAGHICDSVERSFTIGNRGVRAARFYVLKYTRMPSVLVEAGYISNRYEELKLKEPEFLDRIAEALANGILKYKNEFERTEGFTKT